MLIEKPKTVNKKKNKNYPFFPSFPGGRQGRAKLEYKVIGIKGTYISLSASKWIFVIFF